MEYTGEAIEYTRIDYKYKYLFEFEKIYNPF
jgi:hypothetical protein